MGFVPEWSSYRIHMKKSNGTGFRARSVTHAPLAPDYTICDFQSRIKFVKKKKKNENSNQNENLILNQNWNELIPERLVWEQNVVSMSCKQIQGNIRRWNKLVPE